MSQVVHQILYVRWFVKCLQRRHAALSEYLQGRELVLVQADPGWYLRTSEEFVSVSSERIAKKAGKEGRASLIYPAGRPIGRRTVRHIECFVSDQRALQPALTAWVSVDAASSPIVADMPLSPIRSNVVVSWGIDLHVRMIDVVLLNPCSPHRCGLR